MSQNTLLHESQQDLRSQDLPGQVLLDGAQRLLAKALAAEVEDYLSRYADLRDQEGKRLVVRNGHCPSREIQTGLGAVQVRRPRVSDRRVDEEGNRCQFTSKILPPHLRRTKRMEELIPWLWSASSLKPPSAGGGS